MSDDDWVSLASITLASSWGPKADTAARTGTPGPWPPRDRKVTGKPAGLHSSCISSTRDVTRSLTSPGRLSPLRSPLTSAANTGTPMADSCSAMSWRVLVLPVPVAPAMSPWRLHMAAGTCTTASGSTVPPSMALPSSTAGPLLA